MQKSVKLSKFEKNAEEQQQEENTQMQKREQLELALKKMKSALDYNTQ